MDMTAWVSSVIGSRYKLREQTIEGDKRSNVLMIRQTYSCSMFCDRAKVIRDFKKLDDSLEMIQDGLRIKAMADGWQDDDCKLFGITFCIVPNGGYITYNLPPCSDGCESMTGD